ncbi:hypothetical protein [Zhihengliuella halotolerans]|uniref:hypothetical protein n=1 Tax=Zhihengliuella halotolerans TaxID=370736 RepID=UPI0015E07A33|nr:hypothetical protein [Zhihengliuella halotolerans]
MTPTTCLEVDETHKKSPRTQTSRTRIGGDVVVHHLGRGHRREQSANVTSVVR